MSLERDAMIKSLKEIVIPVLRELRFKGSFPHFYRKLEERADLLMFQFSMWGEALYVEISKCPSEGHVDRSGKHIPLNKVKVYDVDVFDGDGLPYRIRIGKEEKGMFEFNKDNTDKISWLIRNALSEAEEWWNSSPNWWSSKNIERN
ncbi:DUF4304 domain-containing protein [Domibacillus sp. DTU_2020_1001157_1_SI_ALB_TIR_016]|uniref:DUF4304 domain-containing protein n=1 Tax=Domibacillus sp. DTU_2020_1001157_1_SI_ALB_TIR_016 TaxID=3077789 RepID=UPI0028E572D0|nr:DUF4304 domain-containing protein [Domibacillus sp. DTU_2020_1001157_1_SI_ALB_TIR_016]WNS79545.1 DUF4304 domain-containing protein [Domibacillus sp. DTU_2020_1001157_1_SI_ALB_TIR_016]